MDKQQMIDRLISHSLQTAGDGEYRENLRELYRKGFPGFANLPEASLKRELQFRGLLAYEEPDEFDVDSDYEQAGEQLISLVSSSARSFASNHFFD